jgi:hypothetical protein
MRKTARETDGGAEMSLEKEISNAIAKCVKNNGGRLPSSEVLAAAIMRMMPPVRYAVWQDPLTEADKAARRSPAIHVVIPGELPSAKADGF